MQLKILNVYAPLFTVEYYLGFNENYTHLDILGKWHINKFKSLMQVFFFFFFFFQCHECNILFSETSLDISELEVIGHNAMYVIVYLF
jgi:hypothetical protein